MSSYTVKAGSGSGSGTASSKAWRVGLSSAFATFLAGLAWGVEMSQNTSWVSLSASPSRQICIMLSTHWLTLVPGSSGSIWLMIR